MRGVTGADLGGVFGERDVADVVQGLERPVAADPGGQGCWWCVAMAGGSDEVDDFDGLVPGAGAGAPQLGDLGGAGELWPSSAVPGRR